MKWRVRAEARKPTKRANGTAHNTNHKAGGRGNSDHHPISPELDECRVLISQWARTWNVPQLEQRVRIEISRRFTTSIGRYDVRHKTIRLAHWLLEHRGLLNEVLCHEAAHAAAFEVRGRRCVPHGKEWKAFMVAAGFEPRVRLPERELPVTRTGRKRSRIVWMHRCPVCNAERTTRRRMTGWRCMRCLKAGRDGKLEITQIGATTAG